MAAHSAYFYLWKGSLPSSSLPLPLWRSSLKLYFLSLPPQCPSRKPSLSLCRQRPQGLIPRSKHRPQQLCLLSEDKGHGGPANRRPLIIILAAALWPAMLFERADLELGVENKAFTSAQQSSPASVLGDGFSLLHQSDPICNLYFTLVP